ncbi:MAG TPA: carbamoyl-phosphate synthase (glutamine-hydrolyzing) large subunit [Rectinemataceae bacterium]|nr:carbamoyl-phosphate synthase (glutamine-hydrolyzing) large subunit [Rectinemataceae bacterium]
MSDDIRRPNKVIVLGSGGLRIGQAGEFDYSGSQALKALREEGIATILVNPNIATIQTSEGMADATYFLPVTPEFVRKVIEKERPDGILLSFGGQTALNCGIALDRDGTLAEFGVTVLGTPVRAIELTEDRELFAKTLGEIGIDTPRSEAATDLEGALAAAGRIGYPVMLRAAYALGGSGSGMCRDEAVLRKRCARALAVAPQVLVEEWLGGWKEIEYEVMRDAYDNCITVCNMENFDPLGIHTGESIVVAPSQTLNDAEYQLLRSVSIRLVRHLGIVGECNVQFALDPLSDSYRVIEVNARLSRSSALASKATGFPLAFVAAKLGLGHALIEIENRMTGATKSCFEPALDYCVVKVPRWDLGKFPEADRAIGSEMKSVGEVMSIGRSFEEALQKALRMTEIGVPGLVADETVPAGPQLRAALRTPTDRRIFAVYKALAEGMSVDKLHAITKIDRWFLSKMAGVLAVERRLALVGAGGGGDAQGGAARLDAELLRDAKRSGFSDARIGELSGMSETSVRSLRESFGIRPLVRQIDTLAAEFPARTNYLYMTYADLAGDGEAYSNASGRGDVEPSGRGVMVLGSGPYRIGSSVEFDWCCVNAVETARKSGRHTIMVNCNPETVSTDWDVCDRLYFEELSLERVLDIRDFERPEGLVLSMGGQIPNNLALALDAAGTVILGTPASSIDRAENRHKFSALCDELGIRQPAWKELTTRADALAFANEVGYPVLIRPSYVLSGAAMKVAWDDASLGEALDLAAGLSSEHPVVVTKFIEGAKEVEIDAVAKRGEILFHTLTEHVENAGIHSGDATVVLPAQRIYLATARKARDIAASLAAALDITGPFNIQFLAQDNRVSVIELNLRASRSFPFCSKVARVNMIELATKAILGEKAARVEASALDLGWVGVKAAQFSFARIHGADPVSGVEMASTGEVGCIGTSLDDAFLKAMLSVGYRRPLRKVLLSTGPIADKVEFLDSARALHDMGCALFASKGTASFLEANGVPATALHWPLEGREPNIETWVRERAFDLVINVPKNNRERELRNDGIIRRLAVDFDIPLITNIKIARRFIRSLARERENGLEIRAWEEYR